MSASTPKCENCRFWRQGDPSPHVDYGNVGVCAWAISGAFTGLRHPDARSETGRTGKHKVPFWLNETIHRTISWEGQNCGSHRPKEDEK